MSIGGRRPTRRLEACEAVRGAQTRGANAFMEERERGVR